MLNLVGGPSSSLQYNNEQVAKDGWFDLLDYSLESFKLALAFKKLGAHGYFLFCSQDYHMRLRNRSMTIDNKSLFFIWYLMPYEGFLCQASNNIV